MPIYSRPGMIPEEAFGIRIYNLIINLDDTPFIFFDDEKIWILKNFIPGLRPYFKLFIMMFYFNDQL